MFDRLEDILIKLEEIMHRLNDSATASDSKVFQKLLKEQAEMKQLILHMRYIGCIINMRSSEDGNASS